MDKSRQAQLPTGAKIIFSEITKQKQKLWLDCSVTTSKIKIVTIQ